MPIHLPYQFPRLDSQEFGTLDYGVMNHAFACHHRLGRLADEQIYQGDLADSLNESGGERAACEVPINLVFDSFSKTLSIDLVVDRQGIYELKTVAKLTKEHESQLLNYLLLTEATRGKLVNFRAPSVESRFVNAHATLSERRGFSVGKESWTAPNYFETLVISLLRDWGAGLSIALYRQALIHLLGGTERVIRQLPIRRHNRIIGHQRFRLLSNDQAFALTGFRDIPDRQRSHFCRLFQHSPIETIHWVNVNIDRVTLTTINKGDE